MKKISKPIVFFGSGPVAAASLKLLLRHCTVEAVITKPKPQHHRGNFPVLTVAKENHLPIFTVTSKKELDAVIEKQSFTSQAGVLIDFGIIVSQYTIDSFSRGIVNSHFSILPELRGADPITFAILSGQASTGVSLMLLVEGMDEGPLLSYSEFRLPSDITTPVLTKNLVQLSDNLLQKHLPQYLKTSEYKLVPQSTTGRKVSYSRKLTKEDGLLDFTKPAQQLEREIRGFIEWPKSRMTVAGKDIIITKAHVRKSDTYDKKPGIVTVLPETKELGVSTRNGALIIDRLIPVGKKEMTAEAFLNGHNFEGLPKVN